MVRALEAGLLAFPRVRLDLIAVEQLSQSYPAQQHCEESSLWMRAAVLICLGGVFSEIDAAAIERPLGRACQVNPKVIGSDVVSRHGLRPMEQPCFVDGGFQFRARKARSQQCLQPQLGPGDVISTQLDPHRQLAHWVLHLQQLPGASTRRDSGLHGLCRRRGACFSQGPVGLSLREKEAMGRVLTAASRTAQLLLDRLSPHEVVHPLALVLHLGHLYNSQLGGHGRTKTVSCHDSAERPVEDKLD
mmetsp:Transcript_17927/g.42157  ORF Transcript_17927/g.42157 Transcript_17927/m.42157 type:complete len:246 (+) Transcript_17927:216-953(+)